MPGGKNGDMLQYESRRWRALWAAPLLLMVYGCHLTMGAAMMLQSGTKGGESMTMGTSLEVGLWTHYFGVKPIDTFLELYAWFFTPAIGGFDPAGRLQLIAFLADLVPMQLIWLIEANRRGNVGTVANMMPTLLAQIYQIRGIGFIAPIYYFLHYIQSPLEKYTAPDQRMVKIGKSKIIMPTIFISYIIPVIAMFAAPELAARQWINAFFFQPFPLWAVLVQYCLSRCVTDTTEKDKVHEDEADMKYLRRGYLSAAVFSTIAYWYVYALAWQSSISLVEVFFKDITKPTTMQPLIEGASKVLRYDYLWSFSAGALWTLLSFKDLKEAGKTSAGWGQIIGAFTIITLCAGPGTSMVVFWAWREELLVSKTVPTSKKD